MEVWENAGPEAGACSQDEGAESHVTDGLKSKGTPRCWEKQGKSGRGRLQWGMSDQHVRE